MIRSKGEAGTGNMVEAVRHIRAITGAIRELSGMDEDELFTGPRSWRALRARARSAEEGGCRSCSSPPAAWPRPRTRR